MAKIVRRYVYVSSLYEKYQQEITVGFLMNVINININIVIEKKMTLSLNRHMLLKEDLNIFC